MTTLHNHHVIAASGAVRRRPGPNIKLDRLTRSVLATLEGGGAAAKHLSALQGANRAALDAEYERLTSLGLVNGPSTRQAVRRQSWPMFAVLALGVVRLFAGLGNHKPVGLLLASLLAAGVLFGLSLRVPRRTQAGQDFLDGLRQRYEYLAPHNSPHFATYGGTSAALSAALFGSAAVMLYNPALAQASVMRAGASDGGFNSGYSGGGCSTGSSCGGGGSSCGGGGCGGGGCGG